MPEIKKVLLLCTKNSVRSQMAEGLMQALGHHRFKAQSAGTAPTQVHPLAIQVMKEIGIDISHHTSKSLNLFLNEEFDYIITLCDHAAMSCPTFPGQGKRLHWSIEDPGTAMGTIEEKLVVFRRIRDEIKTKIEELLKLTS